MASHKSGPPPPFAAAKPPPPTPPLGLMISSTLLVTSPLEQFHLIPLVPLRLGAFDFTLTHSTLMMWMGLVAFLLLVRVLLLEKGGYLLPNRWQVFVESTYELCMGLVSESIHGGRGQKYFPLVFSLFLFVMVSNLTGMVPYSFTSTSHLSVTLGLSMMVFLGYHIICVRKHGIRLLELYYPAGVSLLLAPLIVPIELLARCSQVISLSVRLFANMMAGHTLLKVIAGFAWQMMGGGSLLFFAHLVTLAVLTLLIGLELAVAFIQSYVFAVLTCIYLNDAENLH
jgi:ATP synthase subunit 6